MFQVLWETADCCDAFNSMSLEQAKQDALDLLLEWAMEERHEWNSTRPSPEQIDKWDYMIESCYVEVVERHDDTRPDVDYRTVWYPGREDLQRIGWMYFDELDRK